MNFLHIILIGWLYVTVLVSATEPNIVAGILTFILYGGIPCGLMLYFAGSKVRRQRARHLEALARQQEEVAKEASPEER